jgi:hypothetical protein
MMKRWMRPAVVRIDWTVEVLLSSAPSAAPAEEAGGFFAANVSGRQNTSMAIMAAP